MNDWSLFLKEAGQYLVSTQGKDGNPSKLSNDIRYNMLALSLEKSIMAIVMFNNDLADNHTFSDLLYAVRKYAWIPATISDEILSLEKVQSICSLEQYYREIPSDNVVTRLDVVARYMYELAQQIVAGVETPSAPVAY